MKTSSIHNALPHRVNSILKYKEVAWKLAYNNICPDDTTTIGHGKYTEVCVDIMDREVATVARVATNYLTYIHHNHLSSADDLPISMTFDAILLSDWVEVCEHVRYQLSARNDVTMNPMYHTDMRKYTTAELRLPCMH